MKVIIAGSRTITDLKIIPIVVLHFKNTFHIDLQDGQHEIVSGGAKGVDESGEKWAKIVGNKITTFPANWQKYGKKAGYIRNYQMADYADALIAIWDGKSKGTKHMIDIAIEKELMVFVHEV